MFRRTLVLSFMLAVLGACSASDGGAQVEMVSGQRFEPDRITVDVGDTIVFSNTSDESHTVTAYEDDLPQGAEYFASGGFDDEGAARDSLSAGLLETGDDFEFTPLELGTYTYFCIPHEGSGMTGTIVVQR